MSDTLPPLFRLTVEASGPAPSLDVVGLPAPVIPWVDLDPSRVLLLDRGTGEVVDLTIEEARAVGVPMPPIYRALPESA
ncbi:MAG TPA: hypothetical protein VLT87_11050 [Thermoanaerobaculia bacterium]|nr:hypothetical protein [Thermoanaerobaculia bacterium]